MIRAAAPRREPAPGPAPADRPGPGVPFPARGVPFPARSVPFPAALLDAVMPALTDTQWRLLCVVVRQTLGWQAAPGRDGGARKERDWLTQAQLAARTGRSTRPISRALDALVRRGLVQVLAEDGRPLTTPAARRRYPGRHWFRLGPALTEREDAGPRDAAGRDAEGRDTEGAGDGAGGRDTAERTRAAPGDGAAGVPSAGGKVRTTKESTNKRGPSGSEPLAGSLPEEGRYSEESTQAGESTQAQVVVPEGAGAGREGPSAESGERTHAGRRAGAGGSVLGQLAGATQGPEDGTEGTEYGEVRRLLLAYEQACRRAFPQAPPPSLAWGREGRLAAALLRRCPHGRLLALLGRFLAGAAPAGTPAECSLAAFARALPRLLADAGRRTDEGRGGGTDRRPARPDPVRLWREEEALSIHGPGDRRARREWERRAAGHQWRWDKGAGRWARTGAPPEGEPPAGEPAGRGRSRPSA
ncbi:MAG: hypothetical protein JO250_20705 [Armatimonadetes bacterium]|nr:hypothetical protein [Armatimonadota bacterium]